MNFALIGFPLGHSVSPFIHQELFCLSGITATYENIEISPDKLDVRAIAKNLDGFNVTIPHKTAVIPFLDALCGKAEYLHTVNTVKKQDGKLFGYNTDADGFLKSLELYHILLSGNVLICGAGGTARMMACVAAKHGCNVSICSRLSGIAKAYALADNVMHEFNCNVNVFDNDNISGDFDLLINGTPAGMYPKNIGQTPVSKDVIKRCKAVFDAVYNPQQTALLQYAKANGAKTAYGLPMLVYQAAAAQKIWYGADFSNDDLLGLVEETGEFITKSFNI